MRKTSMILGIIGGVVALLLALALIFMGILVLDTGLWKDAFDILAKEYHGIITEYEFLQSASIGGIVFISLGICAAVAGILGVVGGSIVKRSNVAAGVMMIIATVLSVVSFFNLISIILFVIGSVFAFRREPQSAAPPYAPYPPQQGAGQYAPYPPQNAGQSTYPTQSTWQYPQQSAPQSPSEQSAEQEEPSESEE